MGSERGFGALLKDMKPSHHKALTGKARMMSRSKPQSTEGIIQQKSK
jgi:hypothetical protein